MRTIFNNAAIIDGHGGRPLENAFLTVEDEHIVELGKSENLTILPDDHVVDCSGKHIMPGLIDCHIHMDLHGFGDTYQENLVEDKLRTLRTAQEMTATLKAGFTTVRNVGSVNHIDFAIKAGIEAGYFPGPRILTSGRIICMTSSGSEYFAGMYRVADGIDECRKAAREQLKEGADLLKLMATGAVMNPGGVPGAPQLNEDEMRAVVEEGLKLGKHTAAHAHAAQGIRNAVAAGVRTIEHGTMADNAAIDAMAEAGAYLIPTMSLHELFESHAQNIPAFMLEKSRQMEHDYIDIVKKALKAGVKIAVGTDAGTNYNYHGNNAAEIVYLVKNDILSPSAAITAATKWAAEAIMLDDQLGTVETGKLADMVLVNADPLKNINVLVDPGMISAVYKGGRKI
jgi:imidazolonepropionase-like amidohydrolase